MIYKTVNEDFDFNKIKKHNILDDYSIKQSIRIANTLSPDIVLNKEFGITDNLEDLYALPITNILHDRDSNYGNLLIIGDVINDSADMHIPVIQKSIGLFEERDFKLMSIAFGKFVNEDPNPFNIPNKNRYINDIIEFLKYYYNDIDFSTCVSGNIEFYISPDGGIIYAHLIRLIWEKPFAFISLPNIIFYTGEVLYTNQNESMNEDFDFNKVKSKNILDEYEINPKIVRHVNSDIPFDLLINKVFHVKTDMKEWFNIGRNSYIISNDDIHNINTEEYGNIMCIGKPHSFIDTDINVNPKYVKILEALGFKKHIKYYNFAMFMNNQNINAEYSDYVENFINNYYDIDKDSDGFFEFLVSPDNGIIFIINAKFILSSDRSEFKVLPIMFLYTGDVLYNKEQLLSMNEDFDFNKVKSKNILDEYKLNCNIVRTTIDKNLNMAKLLKQKFNLSVPTNYEQIYNNKLGTILSKSTIEIKYNKVGGYNGSDTKYYVNNIHSLSGTKTPYSQFFETLLYNNNNFKFAYYNTFNNRFFGEDFDPNINDPIKLTLIKLIEYCYSDSIDNIKDIISEPIIGYWVSSDNGIILIKSLLIANNEKSYRWIKMGGFFLYTGDVVYTLNDIK